MPRVSLSTIVPTSFTLPLVPFRHRCISVINAGANIRIRIEYMKLLQVFFKPKDAFNHTIGKLPRPNLSFCCSTSYKMTMFMSPVAAKVLKWFQQDLQVTD
jgi:hypothetical protein